MTQKAVYHRGACGFASVAYCLGVELNVLMFDLVPELCSSSDMSVLEYGKLLEHYTNTDDFGGEGGAAFCVLVQ